MPSPLFSQVYNEKQGVTDRFEVLAYAARINHSKGPLFTFIGTGIRWKTVSDRDMKLRKKPTVHLEAGLLRS